MPRMYVDHYSDLDPTGLPDYIKGSASSPPYSATPSVFDLREVVDYTSLVSTEFYNDFFRAGDIHHDLVAFVSASSSVRGAVCLHRGQQRKPFSAEEVAILDMIAPFIGNHLEKMTSTSVLSVLQMTSGKGVILCDVQGRVLYCNEVARQLCVPMKTIDGAPRLLEDVSFLGYSVGDLEVLAENCNVEVSSREVVLEQG